jgi:hypothetical protein
MIWKGSVVVGKPVIALTVMLVAAVVKVADGVVVTPANAVVPSCARVTVHLVVPARVAPMAVTDITSGVPVNAPLVTLPTMTLNGTAEPKLAAVVAGTRMDVAVELMVAVDVVTEVLAKSAAV